MQKERKNNFVVHLLGDHAIVFSLPPLLQESTLDDLVLLSNFIQSLRLESIKDSIPAYHTLTLIYDIELIEDALSWGNELLHQFENTSTSLTKNLSEIKVITIPVCYDLSVGIDLIQLAEKKQMSAEQIIQTHHEKIYTVYCLGFLPGFAYMGSVHDCIKSERHTKPRAKVFAGSVGIAGEQTGIYPMDSPGGWQIVGRTPRQIFNAAENKLALLKVGDKIKFYPISLEEFNLMNEHILSP